MQLYHYYNTHPKLFTIEALSTLWFQPVHCTSGSVRIVNGPTSSEERVEICHNGVWGKLCDDKMDNTKAIVV